WALACRALQDHVEVVRVERVQEIPRRHPSPHVLLQLQVLEDVRRRERRRAGEIQRPGLVVEQRRPADAENLHPDAEHAMIPDFRHDERARPAYMKEHRLPASSLLEDAVRSEIRRRQPIAVGERYTEELAKRISQPDGSTT